MKLTELVQYVLLESGQFIVSTTLDAFMLDMDKFWLLTKPTLREYAKFRPYTWKRNQYLSGKHVFSTVIEDDSLPEAEQKIIETIPRWISSCLPVGFANALNVPGAHIFRAAVGYDPLNRMGKNLEQPSSWIWKYEKPVLYVPYTGDLDLTMHGDYIVYEEYATGGALKEVDIPDLEYDDVFVKLVTGKFLVAVGRSRRAFTLTDIPVALDSETLVGEGNDMIAEAKESLRENSSWHYSLGN